MSELGQGYVLSAALRFSTGQGSEEWQVLHLGKHKTWNLSASVMNVLSFFDIPRALDELEEEELPVAVSAIELGLLTPAEHAGDEEAWYEWSSAHGWALAGDLLALTNRYPIHDYSRTTVQEKDRAARARVGSYFESAPVEATRALIGRIRGSIASAFRPEDPAAKVTGSQLTQMLAAGFGITDYRGASPDGPTPRGVRPSFGGLWSIRARVWAWEVEGLEPTCYEFDPAQGVLVSRGGSGQIDPAMIPAIARADFDTRALILVSIDWSRLRARYHDPCAVSSALIEAGHAMSTMAMVANALRVSTYLQCGSDESYLTALPEAGLLLGQETAVCAIAVGSQGGAK